MLNQIPRLTNQPARSVKARSSKAEKTFRSSLMTEGTLKRDLVLTLTARMPGAVVMSHTGAIHVGIPDLSVTWNGKTSWWEVKFAKPVLHSRGVQELMMKRLSRHGTAYYVIYHICLL